MTPWHFTRLWASCNRRPSGGGTAFVRVVYATRKTSLWSWRPRRIRRSHCSKEVFRSCTDKGAICTLLAPFPERGARFTGWLECWPTQKKRSTVCLESSKRDVWSRCAASHLLPLRPFVDSSCCPASRPYESASELHKKHPQPSPCDLGQGRQRSSSEMLRRCWEPNFWRVCSICIVWPGVSALG